MLVCTPQDTAYLVDLLSIDQLAPAALQHGELVVHWFHCRGSFRPEDRGSSFCAINSDQSGGSIRAHIHRAASQGGRRASIVSPMVLAVLHPKGGVGRSTTVSQLGAELLALRRKRVRIEDLDPGRHLSRVFERHPLGLEGLQLVSPPIGENDADVDLLDTAPEAQRERALEILRSGYEVGCC